RAGVRHRDVLAGRSARRGRAERHLLQRTRASDRAMSAATETSIYSPLERRLLDDYQHSFPMTARPYADIARECGVSEAEVVAAFERLIAKGAISRIGAVLRPRALGASTLAAMTVPPERLEEVAAA